MKQTIVTGHGRSGTQWLADTLGHFMTAEHEPEDWRADLDMIVDCRLWPHVPEMLRSGRRVMHLVRDGRDVVRSTDEFWLNKGMPRAFEGLCQGWADAVDACRDLDTIRLEDITQPANATPRDQPEQGARARVLSYKSWQAWTPAMTDTFWNTCGDQMKRHGYV